MQFQQVIGQENLKHEWLQKIQGNKLPHAILLLGATGHGGLAFAAALAQRLNCENPMANDSCGTCPSCQKSARLIHPDIHFSFPFSFKKGEKELASDYIQIWRSQFLKYQGYLPLSEWKNQMGSESGQMNINAKECREIIKKLYLKSYEGNYKIMIIWLPEYLGNESNILLKILEEPPEKTIFILVSENHEALLPTLLSRTQIANVLPIQNAALHAALAHQAPEDVDEEKLDQIVKYSKGNYIKSLELLHSSFFENAQLFYDWMQICLNPEKHSKSKQAKDLMAWIENFGKEKKETQKEILDFGIQFFEYFLSESLNESSKNNMFNNIVIENFKKYFPLHQVEPTVTAINEGIYYLERNANAKILIHAISLQIQQFILSPSKKSQYS